MRGQKKLQPGVILALLFTGVSSAYAETLSGTVVDPQQRVIAGARVTLSCGNQAETSKTDGQGHFAFTRPVFPEDCKIRATYPNFMALEVAFGQRRELTLRLRLMEMKQTVAVRETLSSAPLASASLSADDLRMVSDQTSDLIAYAKQLAGVQSNSDHVYVDGLPTDLPPPAAAIATITVDADPFSAEYADSGDTHVEIATKTAERKFHIDSSGLSLGTNARNALNPRLTSNSNTASVGLTGPVPDLPLAFTSNVVFSDRQREQPIEAAVPPLEGSPIAAVDAARATDLNARFSLGADYLKNETLRVTTMLFVLTARHSNMNVSGLTLPEAGLGQEVGGREFRTTFTKTGKDYVDRGGVVANWSDSDLRANSSELGVSVSGAFVGGGAQLSNQSTESTKCTLKDVLEFSQGGHYWSVGATVSRKADSRDITPNPIGYIQFDSLEDYLLSVTAGAATGTGLIMRGQGKVRYASYAAAPFVQGELLRRKRAAVRGGLRADYQTAGGFLVSPRLSAVALLQGFVLKAGSGLFVQDWYNDIFLRVMENDGHHLQQFLITDASLSDIEAGTATLQSNIISKISPNLAPARDWVGKFSVEHPYKNFAPGVEYTETDGRYLLGSERLSAPTGWTDVLESNRARHQDQVHFRARYHFKGQNLTAHYQWIRSFDNTDGPFSFPANQNDLGAEWARSIGVSRHNFTLVANSRLRGGIFFNLVGSWRSPAPYNITTGLDPAHDGLYNDRGGLARNSGTAPAYRDLLLYAHRRMRLPGFRDESNRSLYLNAGLQGDNLLGNRNYVALDSVTGSPLFGKPLAALPGRSLRVCFNIEQ